MSQINIEDFDTNTNRAECMQPMNAAISMALYSGARLEHAVEIRPTWTAASTQTPLTFTKVPADGVMLPKDSTAAAPTMEIYTAVLRANISAIRHSVTSFCASVTYRRQKANHRYIMCISLHKAFACYPGYLEVI